LDQLFRLVALTSIIFFVVTLSRRTIRLPIQSFGSIYLAATKLTH